MRAFGILILTAGFALAQDSAKQTADLVRAVEEQLAASMKARAADTQAVAELERKLAELRKQYTESYPDIRKAVADLNALRAKMAAQTDRSRALEDKVRADQAMLRAQEAKMRAELEQKIGQTLQKPSVLPALPETWWRNESAAKTIGLTAAQIKRMDEIFQQSRLKLIDQKAALDKEEAILEPLVEAESIDESRAATQLDKVAQARAELEKTRGRMLLGIRKQLDTEQWHKLKETRAIAEKMTLR